MSDATPFEVQGEVSQVAACLEVFRGLSPGDWVSLHDLHAQVEELTGATISFESLKGAAWQAGESLPKNNELGIDWYMNGYKRHDAVALAEAAKERGRRAYRDVRRAVARVGAALSQPDLPDPNRHEMQMYQHGLHQTKGLLGRRQNKQRPALPPGEGTT